jgi:hypothetical protein
VLSVLSVAKFSVGVRVVRVVRGEILRGLSVLSVVRG